MDLVQTLHEGYTSYVDMHEGRSHASDSSKGSGGYSSVSFAHSISSLFMILTYYLNMQTLDFCKLEIDEKEIDYFF